MSSRDDQPADGRARDRYYIVTGEEVDRIAVPLTVAHACVQLLRRRIAGGEIDDRDGLVQALAKMEEATRSISAVFRSIMVATTQIRRLGNDP